MKKLFAALSLCSLLIACGAARAEWPSDVTRVKSERGQVVTVSGKLESGRIIDDLSFASKSTVACFPATQNEKFRGRHVFFATELPPRSIMTITVLPKDKSKDLSIYAYQVTTSTFVLPPELSSCVSCEAEHRWDRPKRGKTQDHSRTVKLNATTNPYNVVIAVSHPAGTTAADFELKIALE